MSIQLSFESIAVQNERIEGRVYVRTDAECELEQLILRCVQSDNAYWGGQKITLDYATTNQNGWLIPFSFILQQPETEKGLGISHLPQKELDNREAWSKELAKAAGNFSIQAKLTTNLEERETSSDISL